MGVPGPSSQDSHYSEARAPFGNRWDPSDCVPTTLMGPRLGSWPPVLTCLVVGCIGIWEVGQQMGAFSRVPHISLLSPLVANHRRSVWMALAPWAWRSRGADACRTLPSAVDSTGACPPHTMKQAPSHTAFMGQRSLGACPCPTRTSPLMWT